MTWTLKIALFVLFVMTARSSTSNRSYKSKLQQGVTSTWDQIQARFRAAAEENIHRRASDSASAAQWELDLRLPHLFPLEKPPQGAFGWEKSQMPRIRRVLHTLMGLLGNTSTDSVIVAEAIRMGKYQERIPDWQPFPCNVSGSRSSRRPTRADMLRPGDIDIIAALGDSLTAGNNVAGTRPLHEYVFNRGLTAFAGGQGSWREYLTVANILKEFNPNLYGYSTGDTMFSEQHHHQKLNMAEMATVISDLPDMAKALYNKMLHDPNVDINKDWKMVSVLIGHVDLCLDLCFWKRPQDAILIAEKAFRHTFDFMFDNFPRTVVTFLVTIDLSKLIYSLDYQGRCKTLLPLSCPCFLGRTFQSIQEEYTALTQRILNLQVTIGEDAKYRSRPDFRISTITMLREGASLPRRARDGHNYTDQRYVSPDCFHLSQRGHALAAKNVWNHLVSPRGHARAKWNTDFEKSPFLCPTPLDPYLHI